ncbi:MAG TPA: hypothetical protein VMC80_03195 [Patescibacteria group bacterium]|nr:hypothetical protein [Patescibacteria group bacterium]
MATPNIKIKKKEKLSGVCCDENKMTCDVCSFEDSLKVEIDELNEE